MSALLLSLILLVGLGSPNWAGFRPQPTRRPHRYALVKVWGVDMGPQVPSKFAVCPDGRTYVVTLSTRLVVVSAKGSMLDDEPLVPELRGTYAAACGPHDMLYAVGTRFKVLKWEGPGRIVVGSDAPLPLVAAELIAVARNGEALVRGYGAPGEHVMFLLRQDGTVLAPVGSVPNGKVRLPRGGLRASVTFDARGRRFVEAPWDDYEFHTYSLRGAPLDTFRGNDNNFRPAHDPAGHAGPPIGGDMVPKVVALPDGDFLAQVVRRYTDTGGAIHNSGEYLEVLSASFHHVADAWSWSRGGKYYGDLRGVDAEGSLYLDFAGVPGHFGLVKVRLVKR